MPGKKISHLMFGVLAVLGVNLAHASVTIPIELFNATSGKVQNIGSITAEDSFCGVLLTPDLKGLPPGVHGFHVHVNPSCADNGKAAGGHLDPANSDQHNGPYSKHGHLGDLPVLIVNNDGTATLPTLAPRFKLSQILGHAIMIHAGGDNYSDKPEKLGGGGARIACGVIEKKPA
ncbi:Superoxide dismutase [Cu-Zn] 1 [Aquicella siphonis]|uniref:Superoxide dismutase [Cu-Zn] n=1 Tax=Aquicella siphonis TaxID=254247 RepID=A0A5E4PJ50_9COXI|nr:superoxide dismutase family protein [Aquicella siphonis]VVC77040.1 Superoxide dismutase [Cu-Zn] 1 [Aquicella siphonis]